ncbi:two-component system response regulator [Algibacillus agarilyticus]|uniref:two-component system response regulator n=1 Tax=Algibacillus agarilyticus TaxID=2234133 RepID=UPI000DCF6E1B|nr:EAL domain-containing response regulator [Algibacillus agarilyticus]
MDILVIEDDLLDFEILKRAFSKSSMQFRLVKASTSEEAFTLFKKDAFDIILLDFYLPDQTGLEFITTFKHEFGEDEVAIVVLSHEANPDVAIQCVEAGAEDYLTKTEITPARLKQAIYHSQARLKLRKQLIDSFSQVKYLAERDSLTGLANRRHFEQTLRDELSLNGHAHTHLAVAIVDLDHFKHINDSHGHDVGDQLLIQVAMHISKLISDNLLIARIGGDEFGILLKCNEHQQSIDLELKSLLNDINRVKVNGIEFITSVSIGVAVVPFGNAKSEDVLKCADIAMFKAKNSGRNRLCYFEDEMQAYFDKRYAIEIALHSALDNNEFDIYFQPVFNVKKDVVGVEALIRWIKEGEFIPPDEFIPIAEESTIINDIGYWVLHAAMDKFKQLINETNNDELVLSINISPVQLTDQQLAGHIVQELIKHDLRPKHIELEITETALMVNTEESLDTLEQLSDIGFSIALDDFGTGFSSISHLIDFPINTVKIDKSIMLSSQSERQNKLIHGLAFMIHSLDMDIVAEGVDNPETVSLCDLLNIERLQGFYLSKPQPLSVLKQTFFS